MVCCVGAWGLIVMCDLCVVCRAAAAVDAKVLRARDSYCDAVSSDASFPPRVICVCLSLKYVCESVTDLRCTGKFCILWASHKI